MSKIDYYQIALDKAKELGYDTIRYAGEREGVEILSFDKIFFDREKSRFTSLYKNRFQWNCS